MPDFPSPTTYAIPVFLISIIWEWWAVKTGRVRGDYETGDALTSIAMGLGNVAVNAITATITFWLFAFFWQFRLFEFPVTWWSILGAFIVYDFIYYWKHRFAHRVRWFWAEHSTHHSSQYYNLTTAVRQPWFGPFTGLLLFGTPMVLLGVHPAVMAFVAGLNLLYQYWIHTEAIDRLPKWVEYIFNTPSHHRVHHATNPRYLDANYAGVFITWDRMFGSFVAERDDDRPAYGMVKQLDTHNPFRVAYQEMANLIRDCASDGFRPAIWLGRAFNPPGWSPDGNHMRSEDIRRAFLESHPDMSTDEGFVREQAEKRQA